MSQSPDAAPPVRELLLKLLMSSTGHVLDAGVAIRACALFKISPNNVRVALNRLMSSGLVETVGRGSYKLGPQGLALSREVDLWREVSSRLLDWRGQWVMVLAGVKGRSDRKALRTTDRALALLGFKELDQGVHIRPDNLVGSAQGARDRLRGLGLDPGIPVFVAQDLDADTDAQARGLWAAKALEKAYAQTCRKLNASMARLPGLPVDAAAREAWLLGDAAIRQLVFDPLLPAPLIAEEAREAFINCVRVYDEAGIRYWKRFLN